MRITISLFVSFVIAISVQVSSGQTIEPEKPDISIPIGGTRDVTFTLKDDDLKFVDKITTTNNPNVTVTKKSFDEKSIVLTFNGAGAMLAKTDFTVTFNLSNEKERNITAKVAVIDPTQFGLDIASITDAEQGGANKQIRITPSPEDGRVKVDPSGDPGKIDYKSGVITITPTTAGKFGLDIKVDGIVVKDNFPLTVKAGTSALEANTPRNMKQGEEIKRENLGIKLVTTDVPPRDLSADCITNGTIEPAGDGGIEKIGDKYNVTTKKLSTTSFKLVCSGRFKIISVNIQPALGKVVPDSYSITLKRNSPVKITAQVLDKSGAPMAVDKITWVTDEGKTSEYAKFVEETSREEAAIFLKLRTIPEEGVLKTVRLYAVAQKGDETIKSDPIELVNEKTFNVTGFGKLKIHLDVIDDKSTKDGFGGELMKHYFITKVTFDNNIRDSENRGATILVFNQSIEAKTFIEYEDPDREGNWIPVNRAMVIPNLERNEKNENVEFDWEYWKRNVISKLESRVSRDKVTEFLSLPGRKITDLKKCAIKEDLDFTFPYQPLKYETALLSHESRENRSIKNRFLTALLSLTSLTSFVTNIVGAGGDWPLGQDQFKSLMIPAYQKYFPDRREIHKDHLIQEMMQPLVQIPFGSQESKYLLFPRGPINVSFPMRHWDSTTTNWVIKTVRRIRIKGISPSDTCATVALIRKDE